MKITEHISDHEGSFYLEKEEVKVAELNFNLNEEDLVLLDTRVSTLPGLDLEAEGMMLVMYAVNYARENQLKIIPVCPFANSIFFKNPEIRDILK